LGNHGLHDDPKETRMIPDRIEREVRIDAPVDVVWRIVTEPEQITQWFSEEAELDLREGGEGTLVFQNETTGHQRVVAPLLVVRADPPHAFAYRWSHPEGATADASNSALVEFTLTPDGGGTLLRVVESGIADLAWTDEAKAQYVDEHRAGWATIVDRLRTYATTVPAAR
jgi:uncharacterized protein YndB with AHSA1/START domain